MTRRDSNSGVTCCEEHNTGAGGKNQAGQFRDGLPCVLYRQHLATGFCCGTTICTSRLKGPVYRSVCIHFPPSPLLLSVCCTSGCARSIFYTSYTCACSSLQSRLGSYLLRQANRYLPNDLFLTPVVITTRGVLQHSPFPPPLLSIYRVTVSIFTHHSRLGCPPDAAESVPVFSAHLNIIW